MTPISSFSIQTYIFVLETFEFTLFRKYLFGSIASGFIEPVFADERALSRSTVAAARPIRINGLKNRMIASEFWGRVNDEIGPATAMAG